MIEHWGDLEGARIIATRDFQRIREVAGQLVDEHGIGLIVGPNGVGKSLGCSYAVERLGAPHVSELLGYRPGPSGLVAVVHKAMGGEPLPGRVRARMLAELPFLTGEPVLIHLDEAQQLRGKAMEQLRSIFDTTRRVRFLLSGPPELAHLLRSEPAIVSRIVADHTVRPLSIDDVLEAIPGYHRIYHQADLHLIAQLDEWASGEFRRWAIATKSAERECRRRGLPHINADVVKAIWPRLPRVVP